MRYFMLIALLFISTASYADTVYECRSGDAVRTITVLYHHVENKVPCEVRYYSDSGDKVLWKANKQVGYCEAKAEAFVAKQAGWGWQCKRLEAQ